MAAAQMDYVLNGQGYGEFGQALAETGFDPGIFQPYTVNDAYGRPVRVCAVRTGKRVPVKDPNGKVVVNAKTGRAELDWEKKVVRVTDLIDMGYDVPKANALSLRIDDWRHIESRVTLAARKRLRAWADLSAASQVGGFNAYSTMTYEYEAMSDPGEAVVDMDGLGEGRTDNPLFKIRSVPLPITLSDFFFSDRRLAVSRQRGHQGLDTTMGEAAGRRVGETIEKTLIGVNTGTTFGTDSNRHDGNSTVYGYTTFSPRLTGTLTVPTGSNPEAVLDDVIEMREALYAANKFGPFMFYYTPSYDRYLDNDYFRTGSTAIQRTLRERILAVDGVAGLRRLDYWTGGSTYQMVAVQFEPDTVAAINGMDITTVQWESQGGARKNFRVMAIQVPVFKSDYNGVTGIAHYSS